MVIQLYSGEQQYKNLLLVVQAHGQFFHDGPHSQTKIPTLICSGSMILMRLQCEELVKIIDQLGRETKGKSNSHYFIFTIMALLKKNNY